MTTPATHDLANPFPGLRPYEYAEYPLFFGREGQSVEILRRLQSQRFVAVIGISGSGKSSLIRAGLLPFLDGAFLPDAGSHWRKAIFRPGDAPIRNLACALSSRGVLGPGDQSPVDPMASMFLEATLRSGGLGLIKAVEQAHLGPRDNVLIIVDQMEELFRFAKIAEEEHRSQQEDEASAFVKLLLEATRQTEVPIYVVITMRSDFIGDCARFRDLPETVNEGLYLIPRMTRDQRREAVTGPVKARGVDMAPRLVNRLLNDVGDSPDQLPLLQHALMRTYDLWAQDHQRGEPIDLRHYEAIGGITQALSQHATEAYDELPDADHREIAKRMFQCLTDKSADGREVRRPSRISEFMARTGRGFPPVVETIETFRRAGRSFLMPPPDVQLDANSLIDISHESLINGWGQLEKWVDEEAQSAAVFRRLADTAVLYDEGRAGLYRDPDLEIALAWRDREKPNEEWARRYHSAFAPAMAFLDKSKAARDAQLRELEEQHRRELSRSRKIAAVLSIAGLIAIGFGVFAGYAKIRADALARENAVKAAENKKLADDAARANETIQEQNESLVLKTKAAQDAQFTAESLRKEADARAKEAIRASNKFREEALRANSTLLSDQNRIADLADSYINVSSPKAAIYARRRRESALTQLGDHEGAVKELQAIVEADPESAVAQSSLGYEYLLLGRAKESAEASEKYLKLQPNSSIALLNLAVAQGILGEYASARANVQKAIDDYDPTDSGIYESELAPDVAAATGQRVLVADAWQYDLALRYEMGVLQAVEGDPDFPKTLDSVDRFAKSQRLHPEGSLFASLNWSWLHFRDRPADYAALAASGALWERLAVEDPGFDGCARRAYDRFEQHNANHKDPRYAQIAKWVSTRLARIPAAASCGVLRPGTGDPRELALDARALEYRYSSKTGFIKNAHVNQKLSEAIEMARNTPGNHDTLIELLMQRARIRYSADDYAGARKDCEEVNQLHKTGLSDAYYYLALTDTDDHQKRLDFQKAVDLDPSSDAALREYSLFLVPETDSGQPSKDDLKLALSLDRKRINLSPSNSGAYERVSALEERSGDYRAALRDLRAAIDISPGNSRHFDTQARIDREMNKSQAEIATRLAAGYRKTGDFLWHIGDDGRALADYLRALQTLADTSPSDNPDLQFETEVCVRQISEFLTETYSLRYARDFWTATAEAPSLAPLRERLIAENKRIAPVAQVRKEPSPQP